MSTYSVLQWFVHKIFASTETYCTISSTGVQSKNNVPIDVSSERTTKTDWKPVDRLQTVCQVATSATKDMKRCHCKLQTTSHFSILIFTSQKATSSTVFKSSVGVKNKFYFEIYYYCPFLAIFVIIKTYH